MFLRNSSLSKKGYISSSGVETILPSSNVFEDAVGIISCSGGQITSNIAGPWKLLSHSREPVRFDAFETFLKGSLYALAISFVSGKVRPLSGPAPIFLPSKKRFWVDFIER